MNTNQINENLIKNETTNALPPAPFLRFIASLSFFVSVLCFLILILQSSLANENATIPQGKRAFPQSKTSTGTIQVNPEGAPLQNKVPNPVQAQGGVQVGGEVGGGIESNQSIPYLDVNIDSGEGSKEIITDFNYPDADIVDVAMTLGKLTGKNFILDRNVKGRITIVSNSPITVGDAWKAFLTALDMNAFTLIPSGKYIRIARQRDARDKQLSTYVGNKAPDTDALITQIFNLKYISAEEISRTLRSFVSPSARIVPHSQTNTMIITDTGSNVNKLIEILKLLDVESFDAGIKVIPVQYASAAELSKLIDTLIPDSQGGGGGAGAPRPANRFSSTGRFQARRTKQGGFINNIISDDRTNTLIVHANPKGAEEVQDLVKTLDKKVPYSEGGGKIHVVGLQFADAEEIAKTLNNLSGSSGGAPAPRPSTGAPGAGTGVNPMTASLFEGQIRISADKPSNSLVITASPSDYTTIQRVIQELDIPRDEVYVEVVIMEIQLERNFTFSSSVARPDIGVGIDPGGDLLGFIQNPIGTKGASLGFKSNQSSEFTVGGNKITVPNVLGLIKFLQTNAKGNILASPQILTIDNVEATFETSEKIPVPTSTSTQQGVTAGVDTKKVALSVKIKPQINKTSNFVKLDIKTTLEDILQRDLPAQVKDLAFATFERTAETTILVADSDTVVIGGLTRDKVNESVSKVPILGDIPLLGWLFSSRQSSSSKTNLLMFITPRIIRNYEKIRGILDEKLKKRDNFIEDHAGGEDPMRTYRDDLIRALPSRGELQKTNIDQAFSGETAPKNENGKPTPVEKSPADPAKDLRKTDEELLDEFESF